jgi:hypothetical protein
MNLVNEVRDAWSWKGFEPVAVIAENDFGNILVEDADGGFWRICPDECSCERIAADKSELERLLAKPEFLEDWYMHNVAAVARVACGSLSDGKKYSLKMPACLGGSYSAENFAIVPFAELISFSGDLAFQAKDLADGTQVELRIID